MLLGRHLAGAGLVNIEDVVFEEAKGEKKAAAVKKVPDLEAGSISAFKVAAREQLLKDPTSQRASDLSAEAFRLFGNTLQPARKLLWLLNSLREGLSGIIADDDREQLICRTLRRADSTPTLPGERQEKKRKKRK